MGGPGSRRSDDQQDISRGKGLADVLFQAPHGGGTHVAVMSSLEYTSHGLRQYASDSTVDGYYVAPAFMDKVVVHIAKNFMDLPGIKPLILGIWGAKGQGKSFQCKLVFAKMGVNPIVMSAGELESGNAGEPARLMRQRYREAADVVQKGKMCALFVNDLDAGAGACSCRGSTPARRWLAEVGVEKVGRRLVNSAEAPPAFEPPKVTLCKLMEYGRMLVDEQENVKRVQYMREAALGDANDE
ncbi:hypothetical protein ACP4OV_002645 [Aristida adscensionis]